MDIASVYMSVIMKIYLVTLCQTIFQCNIFFISSSEVSQFF